MSNPGIVQRVAAKAVIVRDGKALILRESGTYEEGTNGGRWQVPGGRINSGEPFFDGLSREVSEETGLKINATEPIHAGEWFPVIGGVKNQIIGLYFVCGSDTEKVKLSDEHDSFQWISAEDIVKYDIIMPDRVAVEKALAR